MTENEKNEKESITNISQSAYLFYKNIIKSRCDIKLFNL